MKLMAFVACAMLVPLVAAAAVPESQKPGLKSTPAVDSKVSITLPGDLSFQFKPGPGSQAATTHCLTCHSSAYVSTQPPLDKAHWDAEVTKMRKVYGATIPDKDAGEIVDYLTAVYGKTT
ncbi:MAG: cytochrome c [Candidatus Elarobacter sp.]